MLNKIKKSILLSFLLIVLLIISYVLLLIFFHQQLLLNKYILSLVVIITIAVISLIMYIMTLTIILPLKHLLNIVDNMLYDNAKYIPGIGTKKEKTFNILKKIINTNYKEKEDLQKAVLKKNEVETILKHLNDGIISFDLEGNITNINNAAKVAFDIDEFWKFDEIFKKINYDCNIDKIIYMEGLINQSSRIDIGDKAYNILFESLKENNAPHGIVVVIQDITEHVKLDDVRKSFVADASHELKTPLTSIIGYSDTLLESGVDEKTTNKFIQKINHEAKRMSELVYDLLTLSKYDLVKQNIEKTKFKVDELTKFVVEKFKEDANNKNIELQTYITGTIPDIYADKSGIERVITNIVSNAIKYTMENGQIDIYVGFLYNEVYIKVKDKGIGIKKTDIDKVFERFYRVDSSRVRSMGGNGLGLPIAKEIVEQNGGQITIKSEYGVGTEVLIRLPIYKGEK